MQHSDDSEGTRGIRLDGVHCRRARRALGLTQEQLSSLTHGQDRLSLPTIKRAEGGAAIDLSSARILAKTLRCELRELTPETFTATGSHPDVDHPLDQTRRVALAIMPFTHTSRASKPDGRTSFFGDGIAEDLLLRLHGSWFPTISYRSMSRYSGRRVDPRDVGEQLNARYVVTGTMHRSRATLRTSVQLIDTLANTLIWTAEYEGKVRDVPRFHHDLSVSIAAAIGGTILDKEANMAAALSKHQPTALESSLRGAWHYYRTTAQDAQLARRYLRRAITRDPLLRHARYWLCMTFAQELSHQWAENPRHTLTDMTACCDDFRRWFPRDPYMLTAMAYRAVYSGEREAAINYLEEAISINQNLAVTRSLFGQVLAMANRPTEAIAELQVALQLSPLDPRRDAFKLAIGLCHFVLADYENMVRWCELAIRDAETSGLAHAALACGLVYLGNRDGALRVVKRMQALGIQCRGLGILMSSTDPDIAGRFMRGLRLAGLRLDTAAQSIIVSTNPRPMKLDARKAKSLGDFMQPGERSNPSPE